MTYAQFLLLFLCVPIAVLAVVCRRRIRRRSVASCALVCLLAYLYTSPWDNHAAAAGLWSYDPHFAPPSHFVFSLPWEEYAFYGLQGIFACLLLIALAPVLMPKESPRL